MIREKIEAPEEGSTGRTLCRSTKKRIYNSAGPNAHRILATVPRCPMPLPSLLSFAHECVRTALSPSGTAIDATAGNGHDTLILAEGVGADGRVFAFDVQTDALESTRRRLADAGMEDRVTLLERSHDTMAAALPKRYHGTVDAIMFNLGYLPGSNKRIITQPKTTLPALQQALVLLRSGGVLTVVLYRGHEGGASEADAVMAWATDRSPDEARVRAYRTLNRPQAPELLAIERQ